jgi:uncharacterized membrane protein
MTGWGFIPVPTPAMNATILHIPAVLGGILEGPLVGAMVGLIFGAYSFLNSAIPLFKDPLIALLPRVLIGVTAYYAFASMRPASALATLSLVMGGFAGYTVSLFNTNLYIYGTVGVIVSLLTVPVARRLGPAYLAPAAAAALGTLTNTIGVLALGVIRGYIPSWKVAGVIAITHGLPEVILAIVVTVSLARALSRVPGLGDRLQERRR